MVAPVVKRDAVAHLQAVHGMSERRACSVIAAGRTSMRYCSRRGDDSDLDVPQRQRKADIEHHHFADHLWCRMKIPKRARRLARDLRFIRAR
jgi:hypothetical protein